MRHPIKSTATGAKPTVAKRDQPGVPQWPSYTGTSQLVGTSPSGKVTVYVDPTLGNPGFRTPKTLSMTPIGSWPLTMRSSGPLAGR
jgi:hypothetical protein